MPDYTEEAAPAIKYPVSPSDLVRDDGPPEGRVNTTSFYASDEIRPRELEHNPDFFDEDSDGLKPEPENSPTPVVYSTYKSDAAGGGSVAHVEVDAVGATVDESEVHKAQPTAEASEGQDRLLTDAGHAPESVPEPPIVTDDRIDHTEEETQAERAVWQPPVVHFLASPAIDHGRSEFVGENADDLPGPEILRNLDPANTIPDRPHIIVPPGRSDVVVRLFPRMGVEDTEHTRAKLEWLNERQAEHLKMLADSAKGFVEVPDIHSFATRLPDNLRHLPNGDTRAELALVSVVRWAEGHRLSEEDPRGLPVIHGLARFLDSLRTSEAGEIPWDFFHHDQYLGNQITDVEPKLKVLDSASFHDNVTRLVDWHSQLQVPANNDLWRSTGSLLGKLFELGLDSPGNEEAVARARRFLVY